MSDLSDERVREIAERLIQNLDEQGACDATDDEVEFLAREVLALRERVASCNANAAPACGTSPHDQSVCWDCYVLQRDTAEVAVSTIAELREQVATLTRQRDEAVAVARGLDEQLGLLCETGSLAVPALTHLRVRLAALEGGGAR